MGICGGALIAWLGCQAIDAFARALRGPFQDAENRFLFYPNQYTATMSSIFNNRVAIRLQGAFRVLRHLGPGYVFETDQHEMFPYPEHVVAALAIAVVLLIYMASFVWGWDRLSHGKVALVFRR